eukprot:NODE_1026_length_1702_cov_226.962540_g964_i0.p1 GENE.NODE_1026_length_1702_cov_226.962540_g964_i0~~NODE_1026_length_1702_cov_226.962540_g964_i0.p1  ORF type:complete len:508 (+),score=113.19 NODE_1026_length_1702_cov_226.962540_g964_i0:56-1579(+)
MDPAMEFGGYVEPPAHLKAASKREAPASRIAELRTIPDYDYSLFRYSKVALPCLLLIMLSAAVLMGLTFWQGPFGIKRGQNGFQDGVPMDFKLRDFDDDREGGLRKVLRSLRCANFCLGSVGLLIAIFGIRKQPSPGLLKALLGLSALLFFALGVISAITFAYGIDDVDMLRDCPDFTFPTMHWGPVVEDLSDERTPCRMREQLTIAAITADAAQCILAFLLCFLLIFTILKKNWAYGPGKVSIAKAVDKPKVQFPPPSPFTHIAETRRAYVWISIFALSVVVITAFILTMVMHELRNRPRQVDSLNRTTFKSGWPQKNNRLRLAISGAAIGFAALTILDLAGWKRRYLAYMFAAFLFWVSVGCFICFGLDVHDIGHARDLDCPTGAPPALVECVHWSYQGTAAVEFILGLFIIVYILYEFFYRVASWDTFYFYADSEWLRNHSLFVDHTDREAFDWKKYVMDSGKEYYYSASLGISTRMRPRNYVEPESYSLAPAFEYGQGQGLMM